MSKVFFINNKMIQCGVYQYGKRLFDILKKSTNFVFIYYEIDNETDYTNLITNTIDNEIVCVLYNYHDQVFRWLNNQNIQKKIINIGLIHEINSNIFDVSVNINPVELENANNKIYCIPRPIFENVDDIINNTEFNIENKYFIESYKNKNIPIFGSFGLAYNMKSKKFENVISLINEQYDEAIIKIVMPKATFYSDPTVHLRIKESCLATNKKKGIIVMITHNFFSTDEIIAFLKSNTMNIFLYDMNIGCGPSSVIDYAVSVKKPIGISDSYMFRHIYSDDICLYKNTIECCKEKSIEICNRFLEQNSNERLINKIDDIIKNNML